ncbi:phospholipid-transporting ATPase ID [Thamnophis elegans]|uniref:phospholipid-transporting ATPase ID n=1 Tax=Thamnophis elegans TaxID=35005 RepID=UPI0013780D09|nr:phospholipid-transporting ATPase ID [Thamnophis elegans]XP_032070254.1 phospholipid-transporting ATPase ID [Thamnophis elegans]
MPLFAPSVDRKTSKEEERCLRANDRSFNLQFDYAKNSIKTSKYNLFTFLPLNLFEQFQRVANAYFLVLLILQLIPEISSLSWFTTVVPLVLVLTVSAVKDAMDDVNRHANDKQVNNRPVKVLINGSLKEDLWLNVEVGDIIKLENNHFVTADILLLCSSEPHSLTYIETTELDGETNLKVKQALTVTAGLGGDLQALSSFNGEIRCEAPNNRLGRFTGTLIFKKEKYALDNDQLLLRGCIIRNTDWCFGLVIFAGPDTKLMQNSGKTTLKRTSIERLMNYLVLVIFLFLGIMCLILAIGNCIWEYNQGYRFQVYLPWATDVKSSFFSAFLVFWSYVIILNTVVPISLYVSVEIIRLANSCYIDWDHKMYYPPHDMPAQARTTTLNEELGQIRYIFSDKTGTLTKNIMIFNKCCIAGKLYGSTLGSDGFLVEDIETMDRVDFSWNPLADPKFVFYDRRLLQAVKARDESTHTFFRLLSLCHTVMPEETKEGTLVYQAQSPDEGALVTAARNFGFVFRARTPTTITVVEMGEMVVYELMAILDFNNVRKRMSVIVRNPRGQLTLYCKGADTILYSLLHPSCKELEEETTEHLDEFAGEGLRTLVVAYRHLEESYFEDWRKRHHKANISLHDREGKLSKVYEEIERDLQLLGATAVEDKLQEGVPQTIEILGRAHIKIWVLTGDKQETAVNIGYSCNMLYDAMKDIFIIHGDSWEEVELELRAAKDRMQIDLEVRTEELDIERSTSSGFWNKEPASGDYGLIINGHSLAHALEGELSELLVETACLCKTVICCRVTPLQKAQVVDLVKKHRKAVTLAIGDGANDVGMIKTAHIGVGISGQEGMQAVMSSDFSFAQFRYLQRLLLVHGRWSYIRMCKFLSYFFYKNFAFTLVHFWFGFFSGFSAQTVYDEWFITLYNMVYTCLPVLGMSLFDQDVDDRWSLQFPQLYVPGQQNLYFNKREFAKCILYSIYSSLVLFLVPYGTIFDSMRNDGKDVSDYQSFALMVQTCLLIVVSVQMGLDTAYWTAVNQLFLWGSLAIYFVITFTLYSDGTYQIFTSSFPFVGTARNILNQPKVWLSICLCVSLCVLPVIGFRFLKMQLMPSLSDQVVRKVRQLRKAPGPPALKRYLQRSASRRSGYAFSHQQGFGDLITSGRNMRLKSPPASSPAFSPYAQKYRPRQEKREGGAS